MGRNPKLIDLHNGGDSLSGKRGVVAFYENLIIKCKQNKDRTTVNGTFINDAFIRRLKFRLAELTV